GATIVCWPAIVTTTSTAAVGRLRSLVATTAEPATTTTRATRAIARTSASPFPVRRGGAQSFHGVARGRASAPEAPADRCGQPGRGCDGREQSQRRRAALRRRDRGSRRRYGHRHAGCRRELVSVRHHGGVGDVRECHVGEKAPRVEE